MGFSSNLKSRALLPRRDGSRSYHMGIKRLFKFKWIRCTKCLASPDTKKYTCRKSTCLLPSVSLVMLQSLSISDKRRFLVVRSDTSSAGVSLPEGHIDNRNSGTLQKVQNWKADCFALLRRRITEFERMCNTAREIEAATQPLCQSSWSSHSATVAERLEQPLSHSARVATQPLSQSGWSRHSATQPERWVAGCSSHSGRVAERLHQASVAECLSGWIASAA